MNGNKCYFARFDYICDKIFAMSNDVISTGELLIDVEKVLRAKAPGLYPRLPRFVIRYLKHIVHQDEINDFVQRASNDVGLAYSAVIIKEFGVHVSATGLDNLPENGRYIFAANHPLGGLDGVAMVGVVGQRFPRLKFPVNDILMYVRNFSEIFVPVNKLGTTGRAAAKVTDDAFFSENQILMFPAGLCSRKINGKIVDLEWKKGFISKAVQCRRDVVPVYISGRNSSFFYNLSRLRKWLKIKVNLEMLYLVDEMYKQRGKEIRFTFGRPIPWQEFEGKNPKECAEKVKKIVYSLPIAREK